MLQECVMKGRVTTLESDEPLAGAIVSVHMTEPQAPEFAWPAPIVSAATDSEWRYTVRLGDSIANAVVSVRKEGYVTVQDTQDMRVPGSIAKNYELREASACIEGMVLGDGKPLSGARVSATFGRIVTLIGNRAHDEQVGVVSGKDGKYTLRAVPAGSARVVAVASGFVPVRQNVPLRAGPWGHMDIQLQPARTVSVIVRNRRGDPLPAAFAIGSWGQTRADEHGKIELTLTPDARVVDCEIGARDYQSSSFTIDSNRPPSEVILEDAVVFSGLILSKAGNPMPGAIVTVMQMGRSGRISPEPVKSDAAGRFVFPLFYPSVCEVRVTKPGYVEKRITYDDQPAPAFLEIRLESPNTGFFGRAVDSDGKPVKRFGLVFGSSSTPTGGVYSRDVENDEGRFCITDIPAGTYRVRFQSNTSTVHLFAEIKELTLKDGYLYGEILVQMSDPVAIKK